MRKFGLFILAFIVMSICSASASAQRPTRISFIPGSTSATVASTLNGYKAHKTFIIKVKKGQTLTTENTGKNYITISIEPPPGSTYEQDMAADCHDKNEVTPTTAGDYKITVTECMKADRWKGTFKFKVSVR